MVVANDNENVNTNTYTPTVVAQVRYMLQWFGEWSEMERGDFLPALVRGFGVGSGAVNGLPPNADGPSKEDGRPLSLFKCRIKLFTEWVRSWSDEDKESFLTGVRSMDVDFAQQYEQKADKQRVVSSPVGEHCNGVNGDENPPEEVVAEAVEEAT